MADRFARWLGSLAVALPWLLASVLSAGASAQEVQITVLVYNRSHMGKKTVKAGEQVAEGMFHQAGVSTTWVDCSLDDQPDSECHKPTSQTRLVLTFIRHWNSETYDSDRLGLALEDESGLGTYCYIFQEHLDELVAETHVSPPRLLGYAMVHEIGHLLKGAHSHSPQGIMSAHWNTDEVDAIRLGALRFTPADVATIRTRLSALSHLQEPQ